MSFFTIDMCLFNGKIIIISFLKKKSQSWISHWVFLIAGTTLLHGKKERGREWGREGGNRGRRGKENCKISQNPKPFQSWRPGCGNLGSVVSGPGLDTSFTGSPFSAFSPSWWTMTSQLGNLQNSKLTVKLIFFCCFLPRTTCIIWNPNKCIHCLISDSNTFPLSRKKSVKRKRRTCESPPKSTGRRRPILVELERPELCTEQRKLESDYVMTYFPHTMKKNTPKEF